MNYYSTSKQSAPVDFRTATIQGQAPDGGLYFPSSIPVLDPQFLSRIKSLPAIELAYRVIQPYVGDTIPAAELYRIVEETLCFEIPLVSITDRIATLELFHGPTLAFKDIGARFMSRCLGYFMKGQSEKVTVLVATSGDTGGAVADGFFNVPGVEVVILYPSGKVSEVQEKQLTTHGQNIKALEVNGSFDDCQALVKRAFRDEETKSRLFLTSANSINVARWLPQQFYYFLAHRQWTGEAPVIAVPSGNFGNICAGLLAMQSGLPVQHFIAACNINDIVSEYMATGSLHLKTAMPTFSNAMDVGNPSNFIRVLELFGNDRNKLASKFSPTIISDDETLATIKRVFTRYDYMLDPHGAVGYLALEKFLGTATSSKGFFLETAHPVKFPSAIHAALEMAPPNPPAIEELMQRSKQSTLIENEYAVFKDFLRNLA